MAVGSVPQNDEPSPHETEPIPAIDAPSALAALPNETATVRERTPKRATPGATIHEIARQAHEEMLRDTGLADWAARLDAQIGARGR